MSNYDWFRPSQAELDRDALERYKEKERLENLKAEGFVETTIHGKVKGFNMSDHVEAVVLECVYCGCAILNKDTHRKNFCP